MDLTSITQIVSSVGFPIAMSLILFWYVTETIKSQREESQRHKEEVEQLASAINELKVTISQLLIVLNKGEK